MLDYYRIRLCPKRQTAGILSFFLVHISADFTCYGLAGALIAKNKDFFNKKAHKIINILCALVLIGFGIYFLSQIFIET